MSAVKKVALVTGGTRGIGYAVAKDMLAHGYAVCIMATRPEATCGEALAALRSLGELFYYQGSLASAEDRQGLVDAVMARYGRIDVLVNNAGIAPKERRDILEMTEESYDDVMDTNLKGTLFLTQAAARAMLAPKEPADGRRGVIVNISSFSATVSSVNRAEYCLSKAGISMLTKLYADRLAGEGIYVYEVQPGIIRTDMTRKVTEKYDRLLNDPNGGFLIHRWGTPEDVANVVSMFVNGNLNYTTGQVVHCDGGYMNVRSL